MFKSVDNNNIAFIYFNEEFCHFGTFQGFSSKLWTERKPLYTTIGFTSDEILFNKEAIEKQCISVNLMENPTKIDAELSNVQKHFLIRQWTLNGRVINFNGFNYQFCWSLMANYIVEKFLSTAKDYHFEVKEIYVFIPSIVHLEIRNLINGLFKLEFPNDIAFKFFDSHDIIPHYLKYSVSQNSLNIKGSETKPVDYIILNRDLHHTFIKYFKLIPTGQRFKLDGQRYTLYYNVKEVDSIMLNHGNLEITESIKGIIREHIEEDGKPEYIQNYTKQEELENVDLTSNFGNNNVSSTWFKYDTSEHVEISYEDFLEVLLPEYFQSEIDAIYNLSNKHSSDGIVPILHLYGIIYERISHRYLENNMSSKIANYQTTNGIVNQLIEAAATVIIGNFDRPTFLPKQLTIGNVDANDHVLYKSFGIATKTNHSALMALNSRIQTEKNVLKSMFKQDIKVWNKYIKDLKEYYNYYVDEIENQWREATRQVCSDDELQAAIERIENYKATVNGLKYSVKTYIKNLYKQENKLNKDGIMKFREYKPFKDAQDKLCKKAEKEIDKLSVVHQFNVTALNAACENYKATITRHDQC